MATAALFRAIAPLVDLVYPPRCPLCAQWVAEQQGLCAACWRDLEFPGEPACGLCARPLSAQRINDTLCHDCDIAPPRHGGISAATMYNRASRQLVLGFKHGGQMTMAPLLARLMAARLGDVGSEWLIVPVPLHRWRLWRRGYNQAALLARALARLTGGRLAVDALLRPRRTPSLAGLGREERARVMQGAISVHPRRGAALVGMRVLLVDDVLTSGATSNACIAALLEAGVREVRIACFARVADGAGEEGAIDG
ncbi:MAG: ComF family protein [Sphingomonadales bacterium]|nr:ComF family protein [Sphingomonadales bacterium]MDE2170208.1 ComF family protein [Sphingomonadales bacterium]